MMRAMASMMGPVSQRKGWSVRGSTRAALDSIDGTLRERLIVNLQSFGRFWFQKREATTES